MSPNLKLSLTPDENITLLEMLSVAMKVINCEDEEFEMGVFESYKKLEQKIFEAVYDHGCDDAEIIAINEITDEFELDEEFEFLSLAHISYEEHIEEKFWENLVVHMADSDLIKRIGELEFEQLDEEERREQTANLEKRLWTEIEQNGVDNLHIIHPPELG